MSTEIFTEKDWGGGKVDVHYRGEAVHSRVPQKYSKSSISYISRGYRFKVRINGGWFPIFKTLDGRVVV